MTWWQLAILPIALTLLLEARSFVTSTRRQRRSSCTPLWSVADPAEIVSWTVDGNDRARFVLRDGRRDYINTGCNCQQCSRILRARPEILAAIQAYTEEPRVSPQEAYTEEPQVSPQEASRRARTLLQSILPDVEAKRLDDAGYFLFKSQSGQNYRITYGVSGNILNIDKSRYYCCYVKSYDRLPSYDHMLAQYLALKYNEKHFLRTAY